MSKSAITKDGEAAIKERLAKLKFEERPKISESIAEARAHGDLKENAEYHAAREQQGFCEARIRDIEAKLSAAQVIDPATLNKEGRVVFGVTVVIENVDTEEEKQYQIVGDDEADFKAGKISVNSPIARGLIGKFEGDEARIETPKGMVEYEVMKVIYN